MGFCINGGADPLGPRGTPSSRLPGRTIEYFQNLGRPARGPAADEGVRPTAYADARLLGNTCGIRLKPAPPPDSPQIPRDQEFGDSS